MPEKQPPAPFDPSVIDKAPLAPDDMLEARAEDLLSGAYTTIGELSEALAAAEAELERSRGQQSVEQVKAALLAPYSKRVFWFVVGYCAVVGGMLVLSGFSEQTEFKLSDTILGIIAGSTAVSVIGLIGMVISGLFGVGKSKAS